MAAATTSPAPPVRQTPSEYADQLFESLVRVTTDHPFQYFRDLHDEHQKLQRKYNKLQDSLHINMEECAGLLKDLRGKETESANKDAEVKRLEKRVAEAAASIETLRQQLEQAIDAGNKLRDTMGIKESEIQTLKSSVDAKVKLVHTANAARDVATKEVERLQNKLQLASSDRDGAVKELEGLKALSAKMEKLSKDQIGRELDAIFGEAQNLALEHFTPDLPSSTLQSFIPPRDCPIRLIPLETPVAKKMRASLALWSIGKSLAFHLLLPTYLLNGKGGSQLSEILYNLAEHDPVREKHVRSVLRGAVSVPDHGQHSRDSIGSISSVSSTSLDSPRSRIRLAVHDVLEDLEALLPQGRRPYPFEIDLANFFTDVHNRWFRLQQSEDLIWPVDPRDAKCADQPWTPLPLMGYSLSSSPSAPTASPSRSGTGGNNGGSGSKNNSNSVNGASSGDKPTSTVWPAFITVFGRSRGTDNQHDHNVLIRARYVLTEGQERAAQAEASAAISDAAPPTPTSPTTMSLRRTSRDAGRKSQPQPHSRVRSLSTGFGSGSKANNAANGNASGTNVPDEGAFLSLGPGAGSEDTV